jgi:hypothetical protein
MHAKLHTHTRTHAYHTTPHALGNLCMMSCMDTDTVSVFHLLPATRAGTARSRDCHGPTTNTVDMHKARGDFEVPVHIPANEFRYELCANWYISHPQLHGNVAIGNRYLNFDLAVTSQKQNISARLGFDLDLPKK